MQKFMQKFAVHVRLTFQPAFLLWCPTFVR